MITYETNEPFGGFKFKEDTQDRTLSEFVSEFLKVDREKGIWLIHKARGSPTYYFFKVMDNGNAHRLEYPTDEGISWIMFNKPDNPNYEMIKGRWFYNNYKEHFIGLRDYIIKKDLSGDIFDIISSSANQKLVDARNDYFRETKSKLNFKEIETKWLIFSSKIKYRPNDYVSKRTSEDIGIKNFSMQRDGTAAVLLMEPKETYIIEGLGDPKENLGYVINNIKMTPTNVLDGTFDKYTNKKGLGREGESASSVISDAIEAAKGQKIGWASNPADL